MGKKSTSKRKMRTSILIGFGILTILIAISLIYYFGFRQAVLSPTGLNSPDVVTAILLNTEADGSTYQLYWDAQPARINLCESSAETYDQESININIVWNPDIGVEAVDLPAYDEGLLINTDFNIDSIHLSSFTAKTDCGGGDEREVQIEEDIQGTCKIDNTQEVGDSTRAIISCHITGILRGYEDDGAGGKTYVPAQINGLETGELEVKILKELPHTDECSVDADCDSMLTPLINGDIYCLNNQLLQDDASVGCFSGTCDYRPAVLEDCEYGCVEGESVCLTEPTGPTNQTTPDVPDDIDDSDGSDIGIKETNWWLIWGIIIVILVILVGGIIYFVKRK